MQGPDAGLLSSLLDPSIRVIRRMTHQMHKPDKRRALPAVDRLLRHATALKLADRHGHELLRDCVRETLEAARCGADVGTVDADALLADAAARIEQRLRPSLRRVFNMTGTVLHTNLGRAPLPEEAIDAMAAVARGACNLEYDVDSGRRGERDGHVERLLLDLTGAEAALVVNNNAAAVLLALNSLARARQVPVSRGELIEIGGAFRIPDIMARAGCRLVEVGTTNRTHLADFAEAIGSRTAALMKVHTSNYRVEGFVASVDERRLASLAHDNGLPLLVDLGSGTLTDLRHHDLPPEPTVRSVLAAGADLVTFSGDKLLGGPQAGLVAGRADLIARLRRNPLKRALRVDKLTLAALGAVLRLYANPQRLRERLPTLRHLARPCEELQTLADRLVPPLAARLQPGFTVVAAAALAQIGSGALPVDSLPSVALCIRTKAGSGSGRRLLRLAAAMRALPVPVIGRLHDDALWLDLRCLDDEAGFHAQLDDLAAP